MYAVILRYFIVIFTIIAIISYYVLLNSSVKRLNICKPVPEKEKEQKTLVIDAEEEENSSYNQSYHISTCDQRIHQLVNRYFEPHQKGITLDMIDDAFLKIEKMPADSMVLFQVKKNKIYVDKRRLDQVPWDKQRFQFLLDRLEEFVMKRQLACRVGRRMISTVADCEKDFEFVADFKDCQSNWANRVPFSYPNRTSEESIARYDSLPIFTLTRCIDRQSIAYVQWYKDRDGEFDNWDVFSNKFIKETRMNDPNSRQKKGVFRGVFTGMTTFTNDTRPSQSITKETWRHLGRGALAYLGKMHSDLLDSQVSIKSYTAHCFTEEDRLTYNGEHNIPLSEQAKKYRYVIYAEGACGWADRLKSLLLFNSTILLQDTKCSEYYKDFLVPWKHYIPVKGDFEDLVEMVKWAREHDKEAADIGMRARMVREELLSVSSMRCYMNLIFEKYSQLVQYPISLREGVEQVYGR